MATQQTKPNEFQRAAEAFQASEVQPENVMEEVAELIEMGVAKVYQFKSRSGSLTRDRVLFRIWPIIYDEGVLSET
jgi:hypothetical protein